MLFPPPFFSLRTALLTLLLCTSGMVHAQSKGFNQPRSGLHTGGQPSEQQLADFARKGVTTVIDLRTAAEDRSYDEEKAARALGLRYVRLPVAGVAGLTPANARALKQALDASKGVLLHCASGNRVGALLALMAKQEEGATPAQALAFGERAGLTSLEPQVRELFRSAGP